MPNPTRFPGLRDTPVTHRSRTLQMPVESGLKAIKFALQSPCLVVYAICHILGIAPSYWVSATDTTRKPKRRRQDPTI